LITRSHDVRRLLGLVLARLASHGDRARLPAVCRAWRYGAQQRPLLPTPLLGLALPDGAFLSLPDGATHRLFPPADFSVRLSTGGKLFLHHGDGSCSLTQSPSSSSSPPAASASDDPLADNDWHRDLLAPLADCSAYKVLLKLVLLSGHLAAVLMKWDRVVVFITRGPPPGALSTMEWAAPQGMSIDDIAIFKEDIYVLTADEELLLLLVPGDEPAQITTVHRVLRRVPRDGPPRLRQAWQWHCYNYATADTCVHRKYLVASGEQLMMVKRELDVPPWGSGIEMRTRRFEVFEAADLLSDGGGGECGRWRQVDTLTGRAIFVSQGCSVSLPGSDQCGGGVGIGQDCIYFVTDDEALSFREDPLFDSGVYDVRNRIVRPLPLPETVVAPAACDDPLVTDLAFPGNLSQVGC
ncbi:hypothetical protein BRADI_1g50966v3, partial [Brachypodium distachyon]